MADYQPRIAIIGGGPGGLTLGRLLYQKGILATIYELRPRPTSEDLDRPCGMLDLHQESGISAIRDCGLYDDFLPLTGECAEEAKVYQRDGQLLHQDFGDHDEGARPEISRHALINLLLSNIRPEMIKWNHKVESVTSSTTASGRTEITVDFGASGKETFDFVIGADGAWSRVRSLLTPIKPHYSGIQMIKLDLQSAATKYPHIADFLGRGTMMALGLKNGVLGQRGAKAAARMYLAVSTPEEKFGDVTGLGKHSAFEATSTLLNERSLFADWAPVFKDIITVACKEESLDNPEDMLDIKPLYMLPIGHRWHTTPGATLIGDAAHLMTPFAGEGVNLAMWDCQDLAIAITKAIEITRKDSGDFQRSLQPLIAEFEKTMLSRAEEKAEETWSNKAMMFDGDEGSENMVNFFKRAGLGEMLAQ